MAPTPNQLMIQQDPSLIQAPQVQEQIAPEQVVKEGEVSMPSPREWVGNIDYGIDWYKLGSQAFATANSVYEDVLKYSISKKTASIKDVQYDYQNQMRNEFAASVKPNSMNYVEQDENKVDFNRPFLTSSYFQESFKKQVNEIIGFKDSDGNLVDVFADDEYDAQGNLIKKGFNFDGFGTAWFNVVETARSGLYDISRDAEKVQSDLLKSFNERFKKDSLFENWSTGKYTSNTDNETISTQQYPYRNGLAPVNPVIETVGTENINFENKTSSGKAVLIPTPNGSVVINPEATEEDLIKTFGINGYSSLVELDAQRAQSARGINLPYRFSERVKTILETNNISVSDAVWLKSNLKYMSQEKIKHLFEVGENFKPLERAKLMVALSYAGYPGQEDITPETFITKVNSIKTPQANQLQALIQDITKDVTTTDTDRPTSGSVLTSRDSAKNILKVLLGAVNDKGEVIDPILNEKIGDTAWFNAYVVNNPSIQPPLYTALLEAQTLRMNNQELSEQDVIKQVTQTLNPILLSDDSGTPIVVRNSLFGSLGQKSTNEEIKSTGYYGNIVNNTMVLKKQGKLIDPVVEERFKQMSPATTAFVTISLSDTIDERDYDSLIESVNRQFVPNSGMISDDTRKKLLESMISVNNNRDGQNTGSTPRLSDALRVLVATNASVIREFNNGQTPKTEKEALEIAGKVYDKIGPAELWGWSYKYNSADDQLINSTEGGIPFNLSSISYTNDIGESINLLDSRMVVTQVNRNNIRFSDSSNGIPYTMLPNKSLLPQNFEEGYSNAERLLFGQRPSVLELNLGTNPTTNNSNFGLISAAQMLGATDNNKLELYRPVIEILSQEELDDFIIPITEHQARVSAKDPEVISRVSELLSRVYDKPKQVYFSALREVLDNEDLFDYIVTADSNDDGEITKLDIINNMHIAAIGYNLNTTFKEGTKDNYPKIQESLFWNSALESEESRPQFSYTGTKLKQEQAESYINQVLEQWYMDGLLGIDELEAISSQVNTAVKKAIDKDIPEALSGIKDVLKQTMEKDLPETTDEFVKTIEQLLKSTTQTILPIDLLMDTEYKSIWKQVAEADIIKSGDILKTPIDTKLNLNLNGIFGKPKTLDEINRYVERFGELPPNINKQQYKELGGTISEEIIYDSNRVNQMFESYPEDAEGNIKIPLNKNTQVSPGKFNAESSDYDINTAKTSGMTPDSSGHWGSVVDASLEDKQKYNLPDESYLILKGKKHKTWNLMEKAENERGFKVVKFGDRYYSIPKETKQVSPGAISDKPYIKLISEFEGLKTEAYWDDTGKVWTIGKGTTRYPDGTPVKKGDKISKQQAEDFAQNYVDTKVIPTLEKTIPTWNEMNPNQQAALVSFAYNLGENFYGRKGFETLTKALSNVDTFDKVPDALKLYNKSGGKKLDGLVRRRKAEANLWLSN
jgi:GH24 family phage-related lysozyme (muramidase)